jgi:hypothetical protein
MMVCGSSWEKAQGWGIDLPGKSENQRCSETQRLVGNSCLLGQVREDGLGKKMTRIGFPGSDSISLLCKRKEK